MLVHGEACSALHLRSDFEDFGSCRRSAHDRSGGSANVDRYER